MRVTTSTLGARGSLRRWRYCVGARLKFWRRSPVPKKGVGTRRLPLVTAAPSNLTRLYYNGSVAKSHSTTTQYRQLRRLCQRLFMRGCQFRSSLKKWPARKASGPERHPFDSAEPITTPLIPKHPESGCFADWFLGNIECFICSDWITRTFRIGNIRCLYVRKI